MRMKEQDEVLAEAARHVRPGGRLVYVTCSILPDENEDRVEAFIRRHPDFDLVDPLARLGAKDPGTAAKLRPFVRLGERVAPVLRLSPATSATDGFFVAVLARGS
jgi:16S rRNA (cytosine967-C5)-methyltransferase